MMVRVGEASLTEKTQTQDPSGPPKEIQAVGVELQLKMQQGKIHSHVFILGAFMLLI